ncbi:hypothetical protein CPB83DRAFT_845137, partial [Crepidotus variabilis]
RVSVALPGRTPFVTSQKDFPVVIISEGFLGPPKKSLKVPLVVSQKAEGTTKMVILGDLSAQKTSFWVKSEMTSKMAPTRKSFWELPEAL